MTERDKILEQVEKTRNRIHIQCICAREELCAKNGPTYYDVNERFRRVQNNVDSIFEDLRMYIEEDEHAN